MLCRFGGFDNRIPLESGGISLKLQKDQEKKITVYCQASAKNARILVLIQNDANQRKMKALT